MKKIKLFAFLTMAIVALSLSSCNKDDDDGPTVPTTGVSSLNEKFDNLTSGAKLTTLTGWSEIQVKGKISWLGAVSSNNKYAQISADNASDNSACETWLITPALDVNAAAKKTLEFKTQQQHWRDGSSLELYVLGELSAKTLNQITEPKVRIVKSTDAAGTWIESGEVDLSSYTSVNSGIVYVAFRYQAIGGPDKSTSIGLDEVLFNSDGGTTNPGGDEIILFNETFGTPTVNTPVASYTGFSKTGIGAANVAYSAEGAAVTARTSSPSVNASTGTAYYTGASGSGNAMMAAAGGAALVIKNIASCSATNLTLSFGSNHVSDTITVSYSADNGTTWTPISYSKTTAEWGLVENLAITLPSGTTCFALKFAGAKTGYGSRVDDITVTTTDATGAAANCSDGGTDPGDGEGTGTGTLADPYNVTRGIEKQSGSDSVWVTGYIVGAVKSGVTSISSAADVEFSAPFSSNTNVLIADNASETDYNKCIAVNLPSGKAVRTEVNLLDNANNKGKKLTVRGKLRSYYGMAGSRDSKGTTDWYVLEGGSVTPPDPNEVFSESFASSLGLFTANNVLGAQEWIWKSGYGADMTGYDGSSSNANEDWLVSPAIDLSGKSSATLTFNHTINKGVVANMATEQTLWMRKSSSDSWTQVTIPTYPAGNNWTFVASGNISIPNDCLTATFQFAFKYTCGASSSAEWEIKNVKVVAQ